MQRKPPHHHKPKIISIPGTGNTQNKLKKQNLPQCAAKPNNLRIALNSGSPYSSLPLLAFRYKYPGTINHDLIANRHLINLTDCQNTLQKSILCTQPSNAFRGSIKQRVKVGKSLFKITKALDENQKQKDKNLEPQCKKNESGTTKIQQQSRNKQNLICQGNCKLEKPSEAQEKLKIKLQESKDKIMSLEKNLLASQNVRLQMVKLKKQSKSMKKVIKQRQAQLLYLYQAISRS